MTYTLTFSHIVEGKRLPLTIDGKEVTKTVEAEGRTNAVYHADIEQFCKENGCSVRRVSP